VGDLTVAILFAVDIPTPSCGLIASKGVLMHGMKVCNFKDIGQGIFKECLCATNF
jgi:hypothetical protein